MEFYVEEENQKKKSKTPVILLITIISLIFFTGLIMFMIFYINSQILTINLDGVKNAELAQILDIKETEQGKVVYVPIRKIAKYLGYEDYSGDYQNKSEDQTKCYVKTEDEVAIFTLGSNKIVKTRGNSDYEYVELDSPIFEQGGELYTTIIGTEKAFNVEISYDANQNSINIYTMDFLVTTLAQKFNINKYSEEFCDKKAIFENMLVVQSESTKQYGVLNLETNKYILECKYDFIQYLPYTQDFLVKSNGKFGILSKDSKIKVKIAYDSIEVLDNEKALYLVKEDNLYGVISTDGKTIINSNYQQIGIDDKNYAQNGIESKYILLDTLIPVKRDNLWGFFDIKGKQITELKYSGVGCSTSRITNTYPVVVIPSHKIIVIEQNKLYNFIGLAGNERIRTFVIDSVYLKKDAATGENSYYITYNGNTKNIDDVLS